MLPVPIVHFTQMASKISMHSKNTRATKHASAFQPQSIRLSLYQYTTICPKVKALSTFLFIVSQKLSAKHRIRASILFLFCFQSVLPSPGMRTRTSVSAPPGFLSHGARRRSPFLLSASAPPGRCLPCSSPSPAGIF